MQETTFVTPPFAGYVSGHSTFSGAASEFLRLFFGADSFQGPSCSLRKEGSSIYEPRLVKGQAGWIAGLTDIPNKVCSIFSQDLQSYDGLGMSTQIFSCLFSQKSELSNQRSKSKYPVCGAGPAHQGLFSSQGYGHVLEQLHRSRSRGWHLAHHGGHPHPLRQCRRNEYWPRSWSPRLQGSLQAMDPAPAGMAGRCTLIA